MPRKSISVFCGANSGHHSHYLHQSLAVIDEMVRQGITLVYGGGNIGLMGAIADRALEQGGKVIGVIPELLVDQEKAHPGLTELHRVQNMYVRKEKLNELADGFIVLPGGIGTLDELFEILALNQVGYQLKPVGLLNTEDYYQNLINFLQHGRDQGFIPARTLELLALESDPVALVQALMNQKKS